MKRDRFGWDRGRGTPAQNRMLADWAEALQDYPLSEVQAACKRAILDEPDKMPNEGHIQKQVEKARDHQRLMYRHANPQPVVVRVEPELRQVPPDMAERAKKILAEVFGDNAITQKEGHADGKPS